MQQSFLTVKLHDLEQQHGRMLARIRTCQKKDTEEIQKEIDRIFEETEEQDFLLQQNVENACSKAVIALSKAQLSYDKDICEITDHVMPEAMHGRESLKEELAEEKMLYAEYCIDFAAQAVRNAYVASLSAIKEQVEYEKWRKEHE